MKWTYPEAIYFLSLVFVIATLFFSLYRRREQILHQLSSKTPIIHRCKKRMLLRVLALCFAWIAAVFAVMQPRVREEHQSTTGQQQDSFIEEASGEEEEFEKQQLAHDVIILLDASASMSVADTRTGQTRLEYAKVIIDDLVSNLKGQEVALYAFTSEATKVVPLTIDYLYLRLMLRKVAINEGDVAGTNFMEALDYMRLEHLEKRRNVAKTLVILTDGGDTKLGDLEGEARLKEQETILGRLEGVEEALTRVFAIGLGTQNGALIPSLSYQGQPVTSDLDEAFLRTLSDKGRGQYYFANDYSSLSIADSIWSSIKIETQEDRVAIKEKLSQVQREKSGAEPEDLGAHLFQIPLALAIFCLLLDLGMRETAKHHQKKDRPV